MKNPVNNSVWLLLALSIALCCEAQATSWPQPKPCQIDLRVEGALSLGETFKVVVELKDAPSHIDGQLYLHLSPGLRVVTGDTLVIISINPSEIKSHEISVKIDSGSKHRISASFVEAGKESRRFGVARKEKYIDLSQATPRALDTVGRDFFRTDSINVIDGIPTKKVPSTLDRSKNASRKSLSTVTVSGTIQYHLDDWNNKQYIPLPRARVAISNFSKSGSEDSYPSRSTSEGVIVFVYTDENGHYSYSGWQWPYTEVTVLTENDVAAVDIAGQPNEFPESFSIINSEMVDLTIDIDIEYSEAAHILRNLHRSYKWCQNHLGYTIGKINVTYYPNQDNTSYHQQGELHIYQFLNGDPEIWDARGRFLVAHEYGHAVMYEAYDHDMPDGGGPSPHYIGSVADNMQFPWKEGWSDFMGVAVYTTPDTNEFQALGYSHVYLGLEKLDDQPPYNNGYPFYQGRDGTNTDGRFVEGAVATALWDIYDSRPIEDDSDGSDDDEVETLIPTLWNLVRTAELSNILGQLFPVQNIYHIYAVWNNFDPYANVFIYTPYPVDENVDVLYNRGHFGYVPSPQPPVYVITDSCGGGQGPQINIYWQSNTTDVSYYDIHQIDMYQDTTYLGTAPRSQGSWTAYDLNPYDPYSFAIKPWWGDFVGVFGSSDTSLPSGYPPASPSHLTAERHYTTCVWTISWVDNSINEEFFAVRVLQGSTGDKDYLYTDPNVTSVYYYSDAWEEMLWVLVFAADTLNCGSCDDLEDPYGCLLLSDPSLDDFFWNDINCEIYACPGLWAWTGAGWALDNNILANSVESDTNHVEYHHVTVPVAESDGRYKFRLIEGNTSVTSIDQVDLYYIEREVDQEMSLDVDGNVYLYGGNAQPVRVVDNLGNDITWLVIEEDGNSYASGNPGYFIAYFEGLPTLSSLAAGDTAGSCPESCGGVPPPPPKKFELPGLAKVNPDGSDDGDAMISNKLDIYVQNGNDWEHVQTLTGSINPSNIFVPLKEYVSKDGSLVVKFEWALAYKLDVLQYKHIKKSWASPKTASSWPVHPTFLSQI